jgi:hypothetical protein
MTRWYHSIAAITISSLFLLEIVPHAFSFQADRPIIIVARRPTSHAVNRISTTSIAAASKKGIDGASDDNDNNDDDRQGGSNAVDQYYRNAPTAILSNFMQSSSSSNNKSNNAVLTKTEEDPLANIDFNSPKQSPKLSLDDLASVLDYELSTKEWFVTGQINPTYFDNTFQFQDPDVKLTGVEAYARGVRKIFDPSTCRAQIISSVVNTSIPNTITVTWRLSGRVNIGPSGLPIKPYIIYTDFIVDETSGLIVYQEDRFDIPGWDIVLSALFPFLIGKVTKEPAPEVEPRVVTMPAILATTAKEEATKNNDIFGGIFRMLKL